MGRHGASISLKVHLHEREKFHKGKRTRARTRLENDDRQMKVCKIELLDKEWRLMMSTAGFGYGNMAVGERTTINDKKWKCTQKPGSRWGIGRTLLSTNLEKIFPMIFAI